MHQPRGGPSHMGPRVGLADDATRTGYAASGIIQIVLNRDFVVRVHPKRQEPSRISS